MTGKKSMICLPYHLLVTAFINLLYLMVTEFFSFTKDNNILQHINEVYGFSFFFFWLNMVFLSEITVVRTYIYIYISLLS